jgi:beta-lactamase class A
MQLQDRLLAIQQDAGFSALGVAVHDYATGRDFGMEADRWFHAASTIKVAVLLAVFRAVDSGALRLEDPVNVRNCSPAIGGTIFRVELIRTGRCLPPANRAQFMTVGALAQVMITRSATR